MGTFLDLILKGAAADKGIGPAVEPPGVTVFLVFADQRRLFSLTPVDGSIGGKRPAYAHSFCRRNVHDMFFYFYNEKTPRAFGAGRRFLYLVAGARNQLWRTIFASDCRKVLRNALTPQELERTVTIRHAPSEASSQWAEGR